MATEVLLRTLPGHVHWCPHCDTEWACDHGVLDCPLGGRVAIEEHCPVPGDDDD